MITPARRVFPGRADQVARARAFVRDCCGLCPVTDEAVLLTSELCTNAVLHSASGVCGGLFKVTVDRSPRIVRVEVRDEGPLPAPEPGGPGILEENGRGLEIVSLLATRWGQMCDHYSRMTYFELHWTPPASPAHTEPAAAAAAGRPRPADHGRPAPARAGRTPGSRPAAVKGWYVTLDGQRLRDLRTERGLSQKSVCEQAGIHPKTISRLEAERWPTCRGRTAALIARTLGTSPESLLAPVPDPSDGQPAPQEGRPEAT